MSWRPEGWKNPCGDEWWTSACQHQYNLAEAFEAGADALLEALKAGGIYGIASGDLECFCLDPIGEPDDHTDYETWRAWVDRRKYPNDIVERGKKVWLIAIPDEE